MPENNCGECKSSNTDVGSRNSRDIDDAIDSIDAEGSDPMYLFPKDGYRVELHESARTGQTSLVMFLTTHDKVFHSWTLQTWLKTDAIVRGEAKRLYWLFVSVAHFLNSGGSVDLLRNHIFDFTIGNDEKDGEFTSRLKPPDLLPPEGMHLLTTTLMNVGCDDGTSREYVFGNLKTGEVLIWIEDMDVRKTTLEELNFELQQMEELEEILDGKVAEVQSTGAVQAQEENLRES